MNKPVAIVIHWFGPYKFEDARKLEGEGLYLVHGRNKLGATPLEGKLLYCGISEDEKGIGSRILKHQERGFNHINNDWWIGR